MKNILTLLKLKSMSIGLKGHLVIILASIIIGTFTYTIVSNLISIEIYQLKIIQFKAEYIINGFIIFIIPMIIVAYTIEEVWGL